MGGEKFKPTKFMAEGSYYDEETAEFAVMFIESLCHTKGKWAGEPFKLLPWQKDIIRNIFGVLKEDGKRQFTTAYIEIPKKNGKQLDVNTPIPTPEGFITMGELKVGDTVFDEMGKPCRVVAKSIPDSTEKAYRLTFIDESTIVAGERHLWDVEYDAEKVQMTTGEIYRSRRAFSIIRIPVCKTLEINREILTADSYIRRFDRTGHTKLNQAEDYHYLKDIEPLDYAVTMQCIQVDSPSHEYLAGTSMIPTHNSELAAAVALYLLFADGEASPEVYGAAADRQQASIVFDVANSMVKMSPALMKRSKSLAANKRIVNYSNNGFYQVLSADVGSKHGLNVSGLVLDEVHAQPNRKLYDVLTKGSGDAREQPLFFLITTAGNDVNSICYELHQKAVDIIEGRKIDPTFYPVIYGASEAEDWTDPEVWKKANPSLGETIQIDKVEAACESAKQNPAEENSFRQLRLNQWVKQAVRWMPMDKWDKCSFEVNPEMLEGRVCYGGLDLSSTTDITAFVLVFPPEDEDDKYYIIPHFWIPEECLDLRVRRDHVPYDIWEKQGFVKTTEGNVIHYGFIEKFIEKLGEVYNIREIAFDRWGATQMTQDLEEMGFNVVPFGQGFSSMSPPTKELMKLVLEEKIAHGGNPVLRWMVDNIFIRTDPAGNIKIDKSKSTEKVDGAVAVVMALDRAIRCGNDTSESVYDSRGILLL